VRLIKLSPVDHDFVNEDALQNYFNEVLPNRNPPGRFYFNRQIREGGLNPNETILLSYKKRLRYVAQVGQARMDNNDGQPYSHYFVINIQTIRPARDNVSLQEVQRDLRLHANFTGTFQGQGWNVIPDSQEAEIVIETFIV
jgi:chorismate mutase